MQSSFAYGTYTSNSCTFSTYWASNRGDSLYDGFHDKIHGQVLQCTQIYFVHPINKNNIYIRFDYKQLLKLFNQL